MPSTDARAGIEWLIGASSVQTLVERFGRERFASSGAVGDPSRLLALGTQDQWLERIRQSARSPAGAAAPTAVFPGAKDGQPRRVRVPLPKLREALEAGGTIELGAAQAYEPTLAELCRRVGRELGYPGAVRVDLRLAPEDGLLCPVDEPALYLQVQGSSRWGEDGAPSTLAPGGFLHLPGAEGMRAGSAISPSTLLVMAFEPVDFATLLERVIWRETGHLPEWRHVEPMLAAEGLYGGPSRSALEALDARLEELLELVASWREDPLRLLRGVAFDRWPAPELEERALVSPEATLELSPGAVVLSASDGACLVLANGAEIEAEGATAEILRRAIARGRFTAAELEIPGVEAESVAATVAALAEAGVFSPSSPG